MSGRWGLAEVLVILPQLELQLPDRLLGLEGDAVLRAEVLELADLELPQRWNLLVLAAVGVLLVDVL